jgi:hypothetical protein
MASTPPPAPLDLLDLSNNIGKSMLFGVGYRKGPTTDADLLGKPGGFIVQDDLGLAASGARDFDVEPTDF